MSVAIISDVHIREEGDKAFQIFHKFMNHDLVMSAERIVLLGDIFDLMAGAHWQYYKRYQQTFEMIRQALARGQEIQYFEGNHDVHLEKLFMSFIKKKNLNPRMMKIIRKSYRENRWEKSFYYSHGDEDEIGNESYKKYKRFIHSKPLEFVANYIMPYKFFTRVGESQSDKSKARNTNYDPEKTKAVYRQSVQVIAEDNYDYIILGHSHIKDEYEGENSKGKKFIYLNNGFAPRSKSFIYIKNGNHNFIDLDLPSL